MSLSARDQAVGLAGVWLEQNPVVLDTETTGLDAADEVVDLAVIDRDGGVLFESLIRPSIPIPMKASRLHGVVDEMVKNSPRMGDVIAKLSDLLMGRVVISYNAQFDRQMICQSLLSSDLYVKRVELGHWCCAMKLYAQYFGEWDAWRKSWRYIALGRAAQQCGIELPTRLHRARADAELCRQLVLHVAGQGVKVEVR